MKLKHSIYRQVVTIVIIMFLVIYVAVAIVLPKALIPIYENKLYNDLKLPLDVVRSDISSSSLEENIAYIFVIDNEVSSSNNLSHITQMSTKRILKEIKHPYGKFDYQGKTYYYNTKNDASGYYKVAITDDDYIVQMKRDILRSLVPALLITLLIILLIVALWTRVLAIRIKKLKDKALHLDDDNYNVKMPYKFDDEITDLSYAIDDMKVTLQKQEEYKNQMYQNISHDFKTPLTVIKSYVEAIEDGMEDEKSGLAIIKQEVKKLEIKVHSLLYLNKLTYMKNADNYKYDTINIVDIISSSAAKFKVARPDIKWNVVIADKKTIFNGSLDMWEAIIDNILSNFMRYADKNIKITVKNHQIILYNDGPNIDETILNDIFTPYKKGVKGQFGLGLSIVKKTVSLLGYEITVRNEKKIGISFIIK